MKYKDFPKTNLICFTSSQNSLKTCWQQHFLAAGVPPAQGSRDAAVPPPLPPLWNKGFWGQLHGASCYTNPSLFFRNIMEKINSPFEKPYVPIDLYLRLYLMLRVAAGGSRFSKSIGCESKHMFFLRA